MAQEFAADFPQPQKLWTIDDLGGWKTVNDSLFKKDVGSIAVIYDKATLVGVVMTTQTLVGRTRTPTHPSRPCHQTPVCETGPPGAGRALGVGVVSLWLSIMVLLPLAAPHGILRRGPQRIPQAVTAPVALASLGSRSSSHWWWPSSTPSWAPSIAWVLVRDDFPGKRIVNALIDLPLALPTIVASIVLLSLYGPSSPVNIHLNATKWGLMVALAFVTLPFVVRSVQPVLIEADREVEEAAASLGAGSWTTFRRVVLPTLGPAVVGGTGLAFARAIGEYGSVVLIGGNIPRETQVASQYIQQQIEIDRPVNAAAVSVALLAIAFLTLFVLRLYISHTQQRGDGPMRTSTTTRLALRTVALAYLLVLLAVPIAVILWRTFGAGVMPFLESVRTPAAIAALNLSLLIVAIVVPVNVVFGITTAIALVRWRFPGRGLMQAVVDLPFAVSPIVVGVSLIMLWGVHGWFGGGVARFHGHLRAAGHGPRHALRHPALRRPRGGAGAPRDRHGPGAGCRDPRCLHVADVLADHPAGHPLGPHVRRGAHHRAGSGGVRRRDHGVLRFPGRLADADPARALPLHRRPQHLRGLRGGVAAHGTGPADAAGHDPARPEEEHLVITVTAARKNYGDFAALDDVGLEIPAGSLTALLGPSGSGKSTLLRSIAGLETLDAGRIDIDGRDVTAVPQRRGIGFVFQHYAAFKHMTVRDNVAFGLTIRKRPRREIDKRVDELLEIVGLGGFQHRYPAQLSGGQRQRMALARALAVDPQVLLLDEPFGALDAKVRADLRRWLRRLHDEVHVTTVLVTHDQEEAWTCRTGSRCSTPGGSSRWARRTSSTSSRRTTS